MSKELGSGLARQSSFVFNSHVPFHETKLSLFRENSVHSTKVVFALPVKLSWVRIWQLVIRAQKIKLSRLGCFLNRSLTEIQLYQIM